MSEFTSELNTSVAKNEGLAISVADFQNGNGKVTNAALAEKTAASFTYFDGKLQKYEEKISNLEKATETLTRDNQVRTNDSTKSLAVFVGFFTFIASSFSILPRISEPFVLIGFILILLASLIFFILLLVWALDSEKQAGLTTKQQYLLGVSSVLLFTGLVSSYYGYSHIVTRENKELLRLEETYYTQTQVDDLLKRQKEQLQEYISNTELPLLKFKMCIATRGVYACLGE